MSPQTIVIGISVAYLTACLAIGASAGRKTSDSAAGFVAGDRALGALVMYFITGATIFSAFAFLGMPGWAYSRGVAGLYILGFGTVGFVPFYFLGPRAARVGRRFGFVTQAEMVAHRFRTPAVAGLMAVISAIAFVPYLAIQMKGAGYVLTEMTSGAVSERVGAALVYTVVLAYVMKSGVLGVGWTNTFQGIFMMVLAWSMGLWLPHVLYGGVGEMFESIAEQRPELLVPPGLDAAGEPWAWGPYSSNILVSIVGFSMWPHLFMKAFSAKDENTLRRTVVLYPTFQLFLVPILILGFAAVLFASAPDKPDQVLPHLLMNAGLSPWIVGLFCAGALAASMSSGDAILHATASILVRDGWVTAARRPLSAQAERTAIRALLVFVLLAAYGLAFVYSDSLVTLLLFAYGPITQFAPGVVATLVWRRASGAAVLAGMLAGIIVTLVLSQRPDLCPWGLHAGLFGLALNVALLVMISLVRPGGTAEDDDFLATAQGR